MSGLKIAHGAPKDLITTFLEVVISIAMFSVGMVIGALIVANGENADQDEAKCTSLYGVYGGGKCYVHGEEQEL